YVLSDDFDVVVFSFFFSSRRRHTISKRDWSSDVCSSDLACVKHAASVHPEPGSNSPQKGVKSPNLTKKTNNTQSINTKCEADQKLLHKEINKPNQTTSS